MPASPTPKMIAVITENEALSAQLGTAFKAAGWGDFLVASRSDEGLAIVRTRLPSLVIIDTGLQGASGFDVCREMRKCEATRAIPVVMISAPCDERDILKGFDAGADDFVSRPFSTQILMARIRAILRRCETTERECVTLDGLVLDNTAHSASLDGQPLSLTPTEYGILHHLLRRQGRVWTRSQIIEAVQGYESTVTERSVDVQIVGLRRKLGVWATHIESVRSVGYKIA